MLESSNKLFYSNVGNDRAKFSLRSQWNCCAFSSYPRVDTKISKQTWQLLGGFGKECDDSSTLGNNTVNNFGLASVIPKLLAARLMQIY